MRVSCTQRFTQVLDMFSGLQALYHRTPPPPRCGIAGVCISLAPDYWYFLLKSPLKHPLSFNKLPKFIQINLDQRQARSCHDPGWSPAWIVLCLQSFVSLWACFMVTAGGVFSELRL